MLIAGCLDKREWSVDSLARRRDSIHRTRSTPATRPHTLSNTHASVIPARRSSTAELVKRESILILLHGNGLPLSRQ